MRPLNAWVAFSPIGASTLGTLIWSAAMVCGSWLALLVPNPGPVPHDLFFFARLEDVDYMLSPFPSPCSPFFFSPPNFGPERCVWNGLFFRFLVPPPRARYPFFARKNASLPIPLSLSLLFAWSRCCVFSKSDHSAVWEASVVPPSSARQRFSF